MKNNVTVVGKYGFIVNVMNQPIKKIKERTTLEDLYRAADLARERVSQMSPEERKALQEETDRLLRIARKYGVLDYEGY